MPGNFLEYPVFFGFFFTLLIMTNDYSFCLSKLYTLYTLQPLFYSVSKNDVSQKNKCKILLVSVCYYCLNRQISSRVLSHIFPVLIWETEVQRNHAEKNDENISKKKLTMRMAKNCTNDGSNEKRFFSLEEFLM